MEKKYLRMNKNEKKFNYGIAILKSFLAFLVLIAHNFKPSSTKNKIILNFTINRRFHVPCFFIISFYLTYISLLSRDKMKIINRFSRLLIPYITWPCIIWIINNVLNELFKNRSFYKLPDSFNVLKNQLLWGNTFMLQFWFQWEILFINLLFVIIIFIFQIHYLFVLQLLLILCYYLQYSQYYLIKNYFPYFPYYCRKNILYTLTSIPYAVTGFTLGIFKIIDRLENIKMQTLIISIIIYSLISTYKIFIIIRGKGFQGIYLNIKSLCVFFIFSIFPSDKIKDKNLSKLLIITTNYSAGVFYLHVSLHSYLCRFIKIIQNKTFTGTIITYLLCNFISHFGVLIFGKTKLKYLFC